MPHSAASDLERWIRQPQGVGFRRALWLIHSYLGILGALYVLTVSVSGSVLVFYHKAVGPDDTYRWITLLHGQLFLGIAGLILVGVGGLLLILMCLTGAVIWWPGVRTWRHSLAVPIRPPRARFNWRLHSATGFWAWAFVFMFAVTGVLLAVPVQWRPRPSLVGRLHVGPIESWPVVILWCLLGLAPALLAVTGALIWWRRGIGSRKC